MKTAAMFALSVVSFIICLHELDARHFSTAIGYLIATLFFLFASYTLDHED